MPLRSIDPFAPNDRMRPSVNPFVGQYLSGLSVGDLPIYGGTSLKGVQGNWRAKLRPTEKSEHLKSSDLIVEIGCHKGNILVAMAKDHPDTSFLGFDITYKRVVTTAQRLQRAKCQNAAAVLANGRGLDQLLALSEVTGFVVFFPDPWPKARHAKNRLLSENFGQILAKLLAPGGWVWVKTDSYSYFVEAEQTLLSAGLVNQDANRPEICRRTYTSTFESHFGSRHQPTVDQVFIKPILC